MCRFVVPWAVFSPVGSRDLLPGVVEVADVLEDPHGRVLCFLAAVAVLKCPRFGKQGGSDFLFVDGC